MRGYHAPFSLVDSWLRLKRDPAPAATHLEGGEPAPETALKTKGKNPAFSAAINTLNANELL
jgi:hypothetical protein